MSPGETSVVSAVDADWPAIARFVANAQKDPTRHVAYVGDDEHSIIAEFAEAAEWDQRCLVLRSGEALSGVILCDLDEEKRRVYWIGPWAASDGSLSGLFDEARSRFRALFDEEEMAPDSRNAAIRTLADSRGFVAEAESDVLSLDGPRVAALTALPMGAGIAAEVGVLHDSIFPGTHRSGEELTDEDTSVLCITEGENVLGYIAFQIQADGSGYIDYLGVAPVARRRGIGRVLVLDACSAMASRGAPSVHLTVRTASAGAASLYQSLGFVRERTIAPYRRGFTLD